MRQVPSYAFSMRKIFGQHSKYETLTFLLSSALGAYFLIGVIPQSASALEAGNISVISSENISTEVSGNVLKVYLNVFRPNDSVDFEIHFNNANPLTILNGQNKQVVPAKSGLQFSLTSGATLSEAALFKPIKVIANSSGSPIVEIYPSPSDFPVIKYAGDTSLISQDVILSTPVVKDGSYAIASQEEFIKFFTKSPGNLIGFRKLSDAQAASSYDGTPTYGYLEQKDFSVTATSPGVWRLLDANFQTVAKIDEVKTKFGTYMPEGHEMTISPEGNPVLITTVTRSVDSSWLNRQFKLPVLDCDIAEVKDGQAIHEFSFWDWAVANKKVSEPLLDAMPIFNDPQNPTSSPIDICHANSMQYNKSTNEYLLSLRSPSILLILSSDLKTVKQIIDAKGALQHFARFNSSTEITALGNFTLAKVSQFLDYKLENGTWKLTEIPFPVHVQFCGNTQYLDSTHIWLAGGCGPFAPDTLGAIYKVDNGTMAKVGSVEMSGFSYSYRGDLVTN